MLLAVWLGLLPGCASLGTRASADFCLVAEPVVIDEADILTDETAKQIEDGICRGVKLCDWDPKGLDCEAR